MQAFLQAFLERATNGHRFADAFHLRGERDGGRLQRPCGMVAVRQHLEGKARPESFRGW